MRLMREEIGYASANLGRERANVRAAYEELGQGHQERDAAPLGVADLARPLRNGLLCGDVVDAGAVSLGAFFINCKDKPPTRARLVPGVSDFFLSDYFLRLNCA